MVLSSAAGVAGITASATLLAAVGFGYITVHTTRLRLDAEAQRQATSLAHERELADIADLRRLLDEAAQVINRMSSAQGAIDYCFMFSEEALKEQADEAVESALAQTREALEPVSSLYARLTVRLGPEDSLTTAFAGAADSLVTGRELASRLEMGLSKRRKTGDEPAEDDNAVAAAREGFYSSSRAFVHAAVDRAGTVLEHSSERRQRG